MLTNEDKIGIANQHLKNLQYNRYNLELSLKEEQAATDPNSAVIEEITTQCATIDAKISVIQTEIASLS